MSYRNASAGRYFPFPRAAAQDKRLSHRALGILVYIASHYHGWQAQENDIIRSHTEGAYAVRQAIAELIRFGYVNRVQARDQAGKIVDWRLDFYDDPDDNPAFNPNAAAPFSPVVEWPEPLLTAAPEPDRDYRDLDEKPDRDFRDLEPHRENRDLDEKPDRDFRDSTIYIEDRSCERDLLDQRVEQDQREEAADAAEHRPPPVTLTPPSAPARNSAPIKKTPNLKTKKPSCKDAGPTRLSIKDRIRNAIDGSPHLREALFTEQGYIPARQGITAVEVYYEYFTILAPAERIDAIMQDRLIAMCPDVARVREVIEAYKLNGYRARNIQLIIDWYYNPARYANNPRTTHGAATTPAPQPGAARPGAPTAGPEEVESEQMAHFRAVEDELRKLPIRLAPPTQGN